jgi:hypothetical protein
MRIRELIVERALEGAELRMEKLKEFVSPGDRILELQQERIDYLKANGPTIKGDQSLLDLEFTNMTMKRGRGGKPYLEFEVKGVNVLCFPNARYGAFITRKKSGV